MIYSTRGYGKTWLALEIAYTVASGGKFLSWEAENPAGVLYIDGEMPLIELQESISSHWNNFLWPLIITRSPEARPVTVGIARYLSPDTGIDIASLSAGTVIVVGPLLIIFLIFQRRFIRSFTRSEII